VRPQAQGNSPSFLKGRHADFARAVGPNPVGNRFAPFTEKKRFFVYLDLSLARGEAECNKP